MRIAVVSDIHGNLTALEAVIADLRLTAPDVVVQGGDLVAGGHRPVEVLARVRERNWPGVLGNTDEMLWRPDLFERFMQTVPQLGRIWQMVFQRQAPLTAALIGAQGVEYLQSMPIAWRDHGVAVVHAGATNVWRSPMHTATDDELAGEYGPLDAPVVAYGHIHVPFVRTIGPLTVANNGSAGMPFDGDPRASYLLIDEGVCATRRVEYDVEAEVKSLLRSGYPDADRIAETLRTAVYVLPPAT